MTEMPGREVTPSGMSLADAARIEAEITAAGFHADAPRVVEKDDGLWLYMVAFEGNEGWDTIFTADQWGRHPDNPNRSEPPGW